MKRGGVDVKTAINEKILTEYQDLITRCPAMMLSNDLPVIEKAFSFACEEIGNETWEKGEFILVHSISVAKIAVLELGLSTDSLISALLHNVYRTGGLDFSPEEVAGMFNPAVSEILEGLIKINSLNTDNLIFHSENFRRLLLTLSGDVRVILIKIADQLQDMRMLEYFSPEFQRKFSTETWHLYAPLAHRLGLYKVNSELLDLSLKYMHPVEFNSIVEKLEETAVERENFVSVFVEPIEKKLKDRGFDFEIKARTKSIFSIWNKMQKQKVDFHEVYDLFAIRIILNSSPENEKAVCWQVFSVVTEEYMSNPDRLRDWITYPKSNGYESLHTTVLGPEKRWVEVQIRTRRMDDIAENGLAAHWRYKGGKGGEEIDKWLKNVREILENPQTNPVDVIDEFKVNIFEDEIFVFTPKGDLIKLRAGATVLDFAYEIHSKIGDHCVGGKVNGKLVTLKHQLKNGDQVSVETSNNQKPKLDWLDYVVTSKAKNRIKVSLNEERKREAENGKEVLHRKFKNWKIELNDQVIRDLLKYFKLKLAADLYYNISTGKIDVLEIKELLAVKKEDSQQERLKEILPSHEIKELTFDTSDDYLIIDNNLKNINYKLAICCNPIFGDDIFGFVTIKDGIKIHRISCPNAKQMIERYPYRLIKAKWNQSVKKNSFQAAIHISGSDRQGIITDISRIITKEVGIQMRAISMDTENKSFDGTVRVYVSDLEHLDFLISKIRNIKGVHSVSRADS